jgi:protein kinase A
VSVKNYEFQKTLGEGSFGRVKLVKSKEDGKFYCAKIMKKIELIKAQQVDHISNEYQILKSISHPFIVNFEGMDQNSKYIYFFMEYIAGG